MGPKVGAAAFLVPRGLAAEHNVLACSGASLALPSAKNPPAGEGRRQGRAGFDLAQGGPDERKVPDPPPLRAGGGGVAGIQI